MGSNRLLVKITHENLPQMKDRYPFIYLERGRLEIDDSSVKWIDSEGHVVVDFTDFDGKVSVFDTVNENMWDY